MFTLVAFYESVDAANAYNDLSAITDPVVRTSGDDLYVPSLTPNVIAAAAGVGSGGNGHVRLSSPSIRGLSRIILEPVNGRNDGNVEPDSPPVVHDFRSRMIRLIPQEILNASVHSDTTAAAVQWCLLWLADAVAALPEGHVFSVRATGTTTLTAGAWTQVPLTFDEDLPAGHYAIVGARFRSTGCIAGRFILVGQSLRPGTIGNDSQADVDWPGSRNGGLGVWADFDDQDLPAADFLALSADTAETVMLDLIRTGDRNAPQAPRTGFA